MLSGVVVVSHLLDALFLSLCLLQRCVSACVWLYLRGECSYAHYLEHLLVSYAKSVIFG